MPGRSDTAVAVALGAAGGAVGTLGRWGAGEAWPHDPHGFPLTTTVVNVVACLLLGVLAGWVSGRVDVRSERLRVLLGPGVLGGLSTWSTFALDGARLLRDGRPGLALASLATALVAGTAAAVAGFALGQGFGAPPPKAQHGHGHDHGAA